jgi:hypothetical protein
VIIMRLAGWRPRRVGLGEARLGIHAFRGNDVAEGRVVGRLHQVERPAGVVCDQVKVLAGRIGDAEGLLSQAVGLVPVSIRLAVVVILVTTATRIGSLPCASPPAAKRVPPLSFHLPICQEAAGYAASAP